MQRQFDGSRSQIPCKTMIRGGSKYRGYDPLANNDAKNSPGPQNYNSLQSLDQTKPRPKFYAKMREIYFDNCRQKALKKLRGGPNQDRSIYFNSPGTAALLDVRLDIVSENRTSSKVVIGSEERFSAMKRQINANNSPGPGSYLQTLGGYRPNTSQFIRMKKMRNRSHAHLKKIIENNMDEIDNLHT